MSHLATSNPTFNPTSAAAADVDMKPSSAMSSGGMSELKKLKKYVRGKDEIDVNFEYDLDMMIENEAEIVKAGQAGGEGLSMLTGAASAGLGALASMGKGAGGMLMGTADLKGVILPTNPRYQIWYMWTIFLVGYSSIMTPLRTAFFSTFVEGSQLEALDRESLGLGIADYLIDAFFGIDIILTFRLAYKNKIGELETDPKKIFWHYITSLQFYMDLLATVPFDLLYTAFSGGDKNKAIGYLGLFRLIRINRIMRLFISLERSTDWDYRKTRLAKFACIIFGTAHWAACLMWFLAADAEFDDGTWVPEDLLNFSLGGQYMRSMYWATTTLTTVGYGDLSPGSNPQELIAGCLFMILNMGITSYLLGNMTVLLTAADESVADYRHEMKNLEKFMAKNQLPEWLRNQMRNTIEMKHRAKDEHTELLDDLPAAVRTRAVRQIYSAETDKSVIMKHTSVEFRDALLSAMKINLIAASTKIIQERDIPGMIYFLAKGSAKYLVISNDDADTDDGFTKSTVSLIYPASESASETASNVIGDKAFFSKTSHLFAVETIDECTMLEVTREDWEEIETNYPEDVKIVTNNVLSEVKNTVQALNDAVSRDAQLAASRPLVAKRVELKKLAIENYSKYESNLKGAVKEINTQVASNVMDLVKSDDVAELSRSKATSGAAFDVNVVDAEGRSAVQVAVESGNTAALEFLLDAGAFPDAIDNHGRTPLLTATQLGQDNTIRILREKGASLGLVSHNPNAPGSAQAIKKIALADGYGSNDAARATANNAGLAPSAATIAISAAEQGRVGALDKLISAGLDTSEMDGDCRTALHAAAGNGQAGAAASLLAAGADPNVSDNAGRTPLYVAVMAGKGGVADDIAKAGGVMGLRKVDYKTYSCTAAPEVANKAGKPDLAPTEYAVLADAVATEDAPLLLSLLKHGVDPNATDYDGRTALHMCCVAGKLSTALLLVKHGAKTDPTDRWGKTPAENAAANGFASAFKPIYPNINAA